MDRRGFPTGVDYEAIQQLAECEPCPERDELLERCERLWPGVTWVIESGSDQ